MPTPHNELWAQTWLIVTLGMLSTFAFLGVLIISLRVMSALAKRCAKPEEKQSDNR